MFVYFHISVTDINEELNFQQFVGVILFVWASYNHHKVHQQFARLRTDEKGRFFRSRLQLFTQFISSPLSQFNCRELFLGQV